MTAEPWAGAGSHTDAWVQAQGKDGQLRGEVWTPLQWVVAWHCSFVLGLKIRKRQAHSRPQLPLSQPGQLPSPRLLLCKSCLAELRRGFGKSRCHVSGYLGPIHYRWVSFSGGGGPPSSLCPTPGPGRVNLGRPYLSQLTLCLGPGGRALEADSRCLR